MICLSRQTLGLALALCACSYLTGCATPSDSPLPPPAPTSAPAAKTDTTRLIKTVADTKLRADVLRMMSSYEAASGNHASLQLISAEPLGKEGASFIERWQLDSNGKPIAYRVRLTPVPQGGTQYSIMRLAD